MSNHLSRCGPSVRHWSRPDKLFEGAFPRNVPAVIWTWVARSRERRGLRELDDDALGDIGVSRVEAWRESQKWFWQR